MSCPLLELRSGHVVVFHVKVSQISLISQLIYDAAKSFTVWIFLHSIETSFDRSRDFPDTSCSSVADGSRQTGGPFLFRNGVRTLRSAADSRFSFTGSILEDGRTRGSSSSSSEAVTVSGQTRGLSSSSSSSSRA